MITQAFGIVISLGKLSYVLKTTPFTIKVEDSLDSADMNVFTVSDNLYVNLINRVIRIENKIGNIGNIDGSFATKKDIENALENIEFESESINFSEIMEVVDGE